MDLLFETPNDLLRMCCVCSKIYLNANGSSQWIGEEHPMYQDLILSYRGNITHGYCSDCYEILMREFQQECKII